VKDVADVLTRELYEEIFPEDEKAFVEYYYQYKLQDNKIFQLMEDGSSIAMIHLNPFIMNIGTKGRRTLERIFYIVAVATKQEYRHQGKMDELLKQSILYMKGQGCPFTFLMPADPKIYSPYQFSYIYDRTDYKVNRELIEKNGFLYRSANENDWEELVRFSNKEQEIKYHVYVNRNIEYYKRIQQELISQGGNIYVLYDRNKIIGYTFTINDQKEQWIQEALIGEKHQSYEVIVESQKKKPIIMARIISLEKIMKWIRIKEQVVQTKPISFLIEVIDPLLAENCGKFIWKINKEGSTLTSFDKNSKDEDITEVSEINKDNIKMDIKIKIETLTTFLFGYREAKDCFKGTDVTIIRKLEMIQVLEQVWINESV